MSSAFLKRVSMRHSVCPMCSYQRFIAAEVKVMFCRLDGLHWGSWNRPHHLLAAVSHLVDSEEAWNEELALLGFVYLHLSGSDCHHCW